MITKELEAQLVNAFANELDLDGKGITAEKLQAVTDLINAIATVRSSKVVKA